MLDNQDPRRKKPTELINKLRKIEPIVFNSDSNSKSSKRPPLASGLAEYTGDWGKIQVAHLLKRTLFGIKQSELNSFEAMNMSDSVDQIISQSQMPAPPVNDYATSGSGISDPDVPFGDTWVEAPYGDDLEGYRIQSLKSWIIGNMLEQDATIHQKLTLFWHNLLVTQFWELFVAKASYKYYKMLYENAFGNYKTLIRALTVDPAMLVFLNGTFNNKEAPDENYGRELQELFCIGKESNATFEEMDVQAAARVLTGWVVDVDSLLMEGVASSFFVPEYHDVDDKQFSSFYDDKIIIGKSGASGAEETDELLDMIFDNQESAAYICRRLYNFFVYHDIDEATEANVIQPLAQLFRSPENKYEIEPVLKMLFKSEHFYDAANIGAVIKSPADHVLGLWRVMNVDRSDDLFTRLITHISINLSLAEQGMEIGDPPSVAGWQAYYQEPSFDKLWINTDTITKRALHQDSLIHWGLWVSENLQITANLPGFIASLNNPGDPNLMIQELGLLMHGVELSADVVDGMKSILLSGQSTDSYWTTAWDLYTSEPENEGYKATVENRLKSMFSPLLQLSEFQLM
jgi:uncharacterized protein (DUF1800 family)